LSYAPTVGIAQEGQNEIIASDALSARLMVPADADTFREDAGKQTRDRISYLSLWSLAHFGRQT